MGKDNNKSNHDFDTKNIKKLLVREHEFITNLFSILPIPASANRDDLTDEEMEVAKHPKHEQLNGQTERAKSLTELRERLKGIQNKRSMYTDKLMKRKLKNKIKKKSKSEEILAQKKLARIGKKNKSALPEHIKDERKSTTETQQTKPIFNKEDKMVFSKFNFSDIGQKSGKKMLKDPKKLLKSIETDKATVAELESKGETEKAKEFKNKKAWKHVLAKAEGFKVKDDPILLKKSIKKKDQIKKGSKKKWQDREEGVKKAQEMRLAKRNENIAKRNKEKKNKKIKKAVRRGKIIPGY